MAAMSLLQRASVTALAALAGRRLGPRLGSGAFLTRGFPKAVGGCWLRGGGRGKKRSQGKRGEEDSARVTLAGPGGSRGLAGLGLRV